MMPVIILGGIRFGIFTPTEAGVLAAVYAMFVRTFYSTANSSFSDLYWVFLRLPNHVGGALPGRRCAGFSLAYSSANIPSRDYRSARTGNGQSLLLIS